MFGEVNLLAIFTTGLLAGGISCIAVQGGLLTTILAQRESETLRQALPHLQAGQGKLVNNNHFLPIASFVFAKLVAYTLLGAFLGWLGSFFQLNLQAQIILQLAVVIFMVGTALNLLNVHPFFRYFVIQPPHFLARLVRKQSKRDDFFAPATLGAFTIFIPCGTTQAMMALAIASGSPWLGSAILFAFILGTTPVFFLLGYFTMRAGDFLKKKFLKVAALVLIMLALFNLNNALNLTGTQYTPFKLLTAAFCVISYCTDDTGQFPVTQQTIFITPTGYSPAQFTVPAGAPITLTLSNTGATGCQQVFTIPALGINRIVAPNKVETITFVAPQKPGIISFMCSMGMYPGVINVL